MRLYLQRRLRATAPNFVRQTYRVMRSLGRQTTSKALPESLVQNCRFHASRYDMLRHLPADGVVCEVGTYIGDFARQIMRLNTPSELHLIDIDYTYFNDVDLTGKNVVRHSGTSLSVLEKFPDAHFDWIYIDADHSFSAVRDDARVAASKVKPGGYLVFNDFAHIDINLGRYGVHRAVVDFAVENAWAFRHFCYEPTAQYDVALQKPA